MCSYHIVRYRSGTVVIRWPRYIFYNNLHVVNYDYQQSQSSVTIISLWHSDWNFSVIPGASVHTTVLICNAQRSAMINTNQPLITPNSLLCLGMLYIINTIASSQELCLNSNLCIHYCYMGLWLWVCPIKSFKNTISTKVYTLDSSYWALYQKKC